MTRLLPLLLLAACGGQTEQLSEAALANQAESLERAANATVDQQIAEIEAAAAAVDLPASTNATTE